MSLRKTNELTGTALDWVVTDIENVETYGIKDWLEQRPHTRANRWSTDWSQGGPVIEREVIDVCAYRSAWRAARYVGTEPTYGHGSTPLIAAMRCYVASKLGEEVEVPNELA